ncbi:alpha/beta hydrolase [Sphingomicrobium astaxanthinifaciens]|uniref:alpha/beta hydrolase n=1 Tax=Sphingomicrobium astaxanthinifaciens TaxID=1227949 RepID=UPI001FCB5073|nr:alpha/beta hydrolase [Sphingomicrobium astaxanthinifaciens]MCJ7422239.1 alpha/beta hydrolase [Sphingomicrobium astaxanthinifaciens]
MLLEERLLFPAHAVGEAGPLPAGARPLETGAASGERLVGIHVPPAGGAASDLLVLGYPGNGWNSADAASLLHALYPDAHVASFHYRGYRASEGRPTAPALIADAPLTHDAALAASGARRVLVVGVSIGTGIAAHLAAERAVEGLILVTPFDSLRKVAGEAIPLLPAGALLRNEIAAADALRPLAVPVAIIEAERDEIISAARTEGLRRAARWIVLDRRIAGAGHNDLYQRADFAAAMAAARAAIEGR